MDVAREYTNRAGYKEKKGEWAFEPFAFNVFVIKSINGWQSTASPRRLTLNQVGQ